MMTTGDVVFVDESGPIGLIQKAVITMEVSDEIPLIIVSLKFEDIGHPKSGLYRLDSIETKGNSSIFHIMKI